MTTKQLTAEAFAQMPLVIEGESKEVRYLGKGLVAIRFKPTIYSFTANRCGIVEGSDRLRLRACSVFIDQLRQAGIKHAYREVQEDFVIADFVRPPDTEYAKYGMKPFIPDDVDLAGLKRGASIEVIMKRFHSGTSKHRYRGMNGVRVRASHPLYGGVGAQIKAEDAYPAPIVRFDWRNPLRDQDGRQVADEILPEDVADWFIDVKKARVTARRVYDALESFLAERDIVLYDICLFIGEDGETVYGEISQDCGRFRHFDLGSLDKDVWRTGGSSSDVLAKWELLLAHIER